MVPSPRASPAPGGTGIGNPPSGGSEEVVPETSMRQAGEQYADFHTGRGGEGNIHRDKYGGHSKPQKKDGEGGGGGGGLMDKAKHAVGLDRKKREESPLKNESST